ncbi:unnamed protein product [Periconia digitata]|uniref:Uncharacterized protein n=1 Tax=Periconia digitata TaxID=1303443 RepID=A0A9W4XPZ2_9PLEO|nr:unnamed protein product [Periconia digitata]
MLDGDWAERGQDTIVLEEENGLAVERFLAIAHGAQQFLPAYIQPAECFPFAVHVDKIDGADKVSAIASAEIQSALIHPRAEDLVPLVPGNIRLNLPTEAFRVAQELARRSTASLRISGDATDVCPVGLIDSVNAVHFQGKNRCQVAVANATKTMKACKGITSAAFFWFTHKCEPLTRAHATGAHRCSPQVRLYHFLDVIVSSTWSNFVVVSHCAGSCRLCLFDKSIRT